MPPYNAALGFPPFSRSMAETPGRPLDPSPALWRLADSTHGLPTAHPGPVPLARVAPWFAGATASTVGGVQALTGAGDPRPVVAGNAKYALLAGTLLCGLGAALVVLGLSGAGDAMAIFVGAGVVLEGLVFVVFGVRQYLRQDPARLLARCLPPHCVLSPAERQAACYELQRIPLRRRQAALDCAPLFPERGRMTFSLWLRLLGSTPDPALCSAAWIAGGLLELAPDALNFAALRGLPWHSDRAIRLYLQRATAGFYDRPLLPADNAAWVRQDAPPVDLENVMNAGRIAACNENIGALVARFGHLYAGTDKQHTARLLAEVHHHLDVNPTHLPPTTLADAKQVVMALPRLTYPGLRRPGLHLDYLLALIWRIIQHKEAMPGQDPRDITNMRHSLVCNLADCIEEDGHRVCDVGISQRLMSTVSGYLEGVPSAQPSELTANVLLAEQVRPLAGRTWSDSALAAFYTQSVRTAQTLWHEPRHADRRDDFMRQLRTFLQLTYDFDAATKAVS